MKSALTALLTLMLMVAAPMMTVAQDDDEIDLSQTYTDPNEAFTIRYPEGWYAINEAGLSGGVIIANDRSTAEDENIPPPGIAGMFLVSTDFLNELSDQDITDYTLSEINQDYVELFIRGNEGMVVTERREHIFPDGAKAISNQFEAELGDGWFVFMQYPHGEWYQFWITTHPGETADFEDIFFAIIGSLRDTDAVQASQTGD